MCSSGRPHTEYAAIAVFATIFPLISVLASHLSCLILCIYYCVLFHSIVLSMAECLIVEIDLRSLC